LPATAASSTTPTITTARSEGLENERATAGNEGALAMSKLLERMKDASRSGVYRSTDDAVILEVLRGSGFDVIALSFAAAQGKESALKALAEALGFPEWFGGNWDALEDCLSDLSWRDAPGWVLIFRDFKGLSRDDFGVLVDVLAGTAESWAERGKLFFAVFVDPQRSLDLPDLYREK
jgi:RNAse (barnase) inhibitor barstar